MSSHGQYVVAPFILSQRTGEVVPKAGRQYAILDLDEACEQADGAAEAGHLGSRQWGVFDGRKPVYTVDFDINKEPDLEGFFDK